MDKEQVEFEKKMKEKDKKYKIARNIAIPLSSAGFTITKGY
jgi:hypothetical protein